MTVEVKCERFIPLVVERSAYRVDVLCARAPGCQQSPIRTFQADLPTAGIFPGRRRWALMVSRTGAGAANQHALAQQSQLEKSHTDLFVERRPSTRLGVDGRSIPAQTCPPVRI